MSYLKELNTIQRQAVTTTDGPVLVVAGPGSGKTRVLTYRIAHLIQTGVPPYKILALTFTNKAAREMKERIKKVVGDKANDVWAGTFHSIFARILRVEADKIDFPNNFTIYDREDSESVIRAILKEQNLNTERYKPRAVLSRISSAKSNLITPRAYAKDEQLKQQDRIQKRPHLHAIYTAYMARCKRAGAMDFDDLLYQMFYLLYKNPDGVLEKYQKKFSHLLVDEFQDTNFLQYAIIKKFVNYAGSPQNICAVGDDAQSIYAFRGATIQNILDFEKDYKNLKTFKLEQNYRSTHHIVQAANDVITHNKRQIPKKIWTDKGQGQRIRVLKAATDGDEGKRVVSLIVEQKSRYHLKNKDIAILYRTNAQSRIFEEHLRRQNIPYRVFGGLSFYQRKEVKDLLAYLKVTINTKDEEALKRALTYPKKGIGKGTIDKINTIANNTNKTMWEAMLTFQSGKKITGAIRGFVQTIQSFQKRAKTEDAYAVAEFVARKTKILDKLKTDTTIEGANRLNNLLALLDSIKDFTENDELIDEATVPDKTLATYLQNVALHTDMDNEEGADNRVNLMSVHSAKGLEFPSIFVVGMEETLFPSYTPNNRNREDIDEERRLFYVAITRAEKYLTLSYAQNRYRFGKNQKFEPSQFLEEISEKHVEGDILFQPFATVSSPRFNPLQGSRFKKPTPPKIPVNFKPSPPHLFKKRMYVIHKRFGRGQILKIEGSEPNKMARVFFDELNEEKRLILRFAKLMIVQ